MRVLAYSVCVSVFHDGLSHSVDAVAKVPFAIHTGFYVILNAQGIVVCVCQRVFIFGRRLYIRRHNVCISKNPGNKQLLVVWPSITTLYVHYDESKRHMLTNLTANTIFREFSQYSQEHANLRIGHHNSVHVLF